MKTQENNMSQANFEIGQGATLSVGSDRYAYTVTSMVTLNIIEITRDSVKQIGDYYGKQEYQYTPNPNGAKLYFKWDKGSWYEVTRNLNTGRWNKVRTSYRLFVGTRNEYSDPSF